MRRVSHFIEYLLVLSVVKLGCILPLRASLFAGRLIGKTAFNLVRARQRVTIANLEAAFGKEKTREEIVGIAKRCYENIGQTFIEFGRFPVTKPETIRKLVRIEGLEHLRDAMAAGKGGLFVAGHFGSWELMGASFFAYGFPVSFLVGEQSNRAVDNMMNRYREACGIKIIPMGISMRKVLKTLRSNEFVALLSDQDAGRKGVFVDFFGRKASTPFGPAAFSLRTGSPIIVCSIVRGERGKHTVILEKPVYPEPSGDEQRDIERYTQLYTSVIEKYVRQYPDHWYWLHRRWKTSPK
ncbi:MAG: lysophospholipid acyltransferase family protein [Candidatus Eisenbacteria bacterium]|nr:lysophospholipid acyltransferase family protein [Candidatus Eisenbacteria bacterium]